MTFMHLPVVLGLGDADLDLDLTIGADATAGDVVATLAGGDLTDATTLWVDGRAVDLDESGVGHRAATRVPPHTRAAPRPRRRARTVPRSPSSP